MIGFSYGLAGQEFYCHRFRFSGKSSKFVGMVIIFVIYPSEIIDLFSHLPD